jgi:hypothetical protein
MEHYEYLRRHYSHCFPKPRFRVSIDVRNEGSKCVIVPLCTENGLRFSAHLGSGEPEVRFERVV